MTARREDATSSELRHDWLADRWVIIAPQRTERPFDFVKYVDVPREIQHCPFCRGQEAETPKAVANYFRRGEDKPRDWVVRVVPNKFPAVSDLGQENLSGIHTEDALPHAEKIDLFRRRDLSGGHEVIVESPLHIHSISQLAPEETRLVFTAYRDRLRFWIEDRKVCYAVVFKNVGQDAGASLAHSHSQLISTNILPPDVKRASERMEQFLQEKGECLFCSLVRGELEQGERVVEETPDFVALCPFASRLPSLVSIFPKKHSPRFERLPDSELEQLSWLTHRMVRRIENCYPDVAYNFVLHTAPGCEENRDYFHWRIELFPRLTKVAGFEWGSDCYINPLRPEDAAAALRDVGV